MNEQRVGTVEVEGTFDHEKLDVYRAARELVVLVSGFLKRNASRNLRDQLDRSSTSILFNIAEGAGKTARGDKQRFYEIARGSATEAAAQLDVLHLRDVISIRAISRGPAAAPSDRPDAEPPRRRQPNRLTRAPPTFTRRSYAKANPLSVDGRRIPSAREPNAFTSGLRLRGWCSLPPDSQHYFGNTGSTPVAAASSKKWSTTAAVTSGSRDGAGVITSSPRYSPCAPGRMTSRAPVISRGELHGVLRPHDVAVSRRINVGARTERTCSSGTSSKWSIRSASLSCITRSFEASGFTFRNASFRGWGIFEKSA